MGVMSNKVSKFRQTEWLLRYYPSYKTLIEEKEARIKLLKKYGLEEYSKSVVVLSSASSSFTNRDLEDMLEEEIDKNVKQVAWLSGVVGLIDMGLASVKDNPYYGIIELKYWKGWSMETMADYYNTATTTIYRNRNKLVHNIKNVVFAGDMLKAIIQNMD